MKQDWYSTCNIIRHIIKSEIEMGNIDLNDSATWDTYAAEFADGCEWVIYTGRAIDIWASDCVVQGFEDYIAEWISPTASIDERITACVYAATETEVMAAIGEAAQDA